jgi:hypothetical protein
LTSVSDTGIGTMVISTCPRDIAITITIAMTIAGKTSTAAADPSK